MQWAQNETYYLKSVHVSFGLYIPHVVSKTRFHVCKSVSFACTEASELTWKLTAEQDEAESHGTKNHIYQESAGYRISNIQLAYCH
jgi:hypothetical protein